MVLLISYDLNGRERPSSYTAVREVIEANAIDSRRPLYSQWFVQTNTAPDAWVEGLRQVIDDDDNLFVSQVQQPCRGWLDRRIWDWLSARI